MAVVDWELGVLFVPVGVVLFGRAQSIRQRHVPAAEIVFAVDIGFAGGLDFEHRI